MNGECNYYNNLITMINESLYNLTTINSQMSSLLSKIQLVVLLISQFSTVRRYGTPPQSVDCLKDLFTALFHESTSKKNSKNIFLLDIFSPGK